MAGKFTWPHAWVLALAQSQAERRCLNLILQKSGEVVDSNGEN
jgi:hypothetical protein